MRCLFCLLVLVWLPLNFAEAQTRVVPREGTEWCGIRVANATKTGLPRVLLIGDSVKEAVMKLLN